MTKYFSMQIISAPEQYDLVVIAIRPRQVPPC